MQRSNKRLDVHNGLTPLENDFVKEFTTPGKNFLNGTKSMKKVAPYVKDTSAQTNASAMLKREPVKKALKDILDQTAYKTIIDKRLKGILEDEETRPRDLIGAIDLWSKITGAYAPEKHVNVNLEPEARDERYEEVMKKVREAQEVVNVAVPKET